MAPIGLAILALGIIGLIYGILQRMKAGRVTDAPFATTGDIAGRGPQLAGPRGAISTQGNVVCQQPLVSPVTGVPCLFYELKVTAEWKDGDTTKTKEIEHQKVAAQLALNDGSGPVWVDLREGGDFEPTVEKKMEQSTGLLKGIVGGELTFGNYRLGTGMGSIGTTYKVEEEVLPVQSSLYVCGKLADGGGVITAPSWRSMIVSNQSRDQLLAAATKSAKISLIAGAAAAVAGIALAVIGSMLAPASNSDASTASAATVTAPTESAEAAPSEPAPTASASAASAANVPWKKPGTTAAKPASASASASAATTGAPAATAPAPSATSATTTARATTTAAAASTPASKPATKPTLKLKK